MSIRVIAQINPLTTHRIEKEYGSGKTLYEILELLEVDKDENPVYISVNGEPVEDFSFTTSEDDLVLIKVVPAGDNAGPMIQSVVAFGLIAAGIATGGIALGVAGLLLVGLTAGGIDIVDTIAGIFKSAGLPEDPANPRLKGETGNYLRGGTNSIKKNGDIPVIFGAHRYYPYQVAEPYSVFNLLDNAPDLGVIDSITCQNFSQEIRQMFLWGHKEVTAIDGTYKRGDTNVAEIAGTVVYDDSTGEYGVKAKKFLNVSKSLKAYVRDPDSDNAGYTVLRIFLPTGLTEVELGFITGSFYTFGLTEDGEREVGATPKSLIQFGLYDETAETVISLGSGGKGLDANGDPWPIVGNASEQTILGKRVEPGTTVSPTAFNYTVPYTLDPTHQYTLYVGRLNDNPEDETSIFYSPRVEAYNIDISLVHIIGTSDQDTISTAATSAFSYANVVLEDIQKNDYGSSELTGEINDFNAVVNTTLPIWDGVTSGPTGWSTTAVTSNPASAYLYVLQGAINKRPVLDSEIDWNSLEDWYTFCVDESLECNLVIDNPGSVESILTTIALTGRAVPYFEDNYGVIVDKERTAPMQMITNKNSIGMTSDRRLSSELHAVTYEYIDKAYDYDTNTETVYKDGYDKDSSGGKTPATKIVSQTMPGVTSVDQVRHLGKYYLNCEDRRVETLSVTMDAEYVLCRQGDWVTVSYDELLQGLERGRVVSVATSGSNVTSITIDEYVTLEVGKSYGFIVRIDDNTQTIPISVEDVLFETTTNVLTLETPGPYAIQAGDLYTVGEATNIVEDYIVTEVQPTEDLRAQLSLINYAPEVYDLANITSWSPTISIPGDFGPSMILEDLYDVTEVALQAQAEVQRIDTVVDPSLRYAIKTGVPAATLLDSEAIELKMSDNYLYYVDKNDFKVYRRTTLVSATPDLIVNTEVKEIAVDQADTYLVYSSLADGNKLYLYDLVNLTTTQITNVVSTNPVIVNDTDVLYINREDSNKVYLTNISDTDSGNIVLDYPVTSFDHFNGIMTYMSPEKSSIYNKNIYDGDITNIGALWKNVAGTNIVSTNPALWFTPNVEVAPLYVDSINQIAYINNQPFYGDVSRHTMDSEGNYTFVTPRGEMYFADLAGISNQARLDAEVDIELNYVDGDLIENDTRIYNIGVEDIDAFAWNDDIAGIGIPENTTVTFVGSNFIVMSKPATATLPNNPIEITGTRLVLDANKVIIPGTVEAGLLATDAINSLDRVPNDAPVIENRGQQLYQHDLQVGTEIQYDTDGNIIRTFDPENGLWLRAGVSVGGEAPFTGNPIPLDPKFTDTQNKTWVQNTYPSTALDNELWFVTDNDVVEGSDTYLQNVLYAKRSSSPDVWEATTNYELRGTTYRLSDNPPTVGAYPLLQEGDYWFNTGTVTGTYAINTLYVLADLGTNEWETVTPQNVDNFASNTQVLRDSTEPIKGTDPGEYPNLVEGWLWNPSVDVGSFYANTLYRYTGTEWLPSGAENVEDNSTQNVIVTSPTVPLDPTKGMIWQCTADVSIYKANTSYTYNGSSWYSLGPTGVQDFANETTNNYYGSVEPTFDLQEGDTWYVTADVSTFIAGRTYVYDGATWEESATKNAFYKDSEAPTTNIFAGDLWFCTEDITGPPAYTQNTTYYYDGTNWIIYSPEGVYDYANNTTTTYYQSTLPVDGDSPDGLHVGDTFKPTANIGTDPILYYATRTYVYDGTNWPEATPSNLAELDSEQNDKLTNIEENATNSFVLTDATEPTTITYPNLVEGWLWNPSVDNDTFFANTLYRYSGSSWEKAGAENVSDGATQNTIIISATEPTTPSTGTIWQCTADIGTAPDYDYYANTSYTYNGASWDSLGPTGVEDFSNSTTNMYYGATEPTTNLREGDTWYVTADVSTFIAGRTYVYDGVEWKESATKNAFYKDSVAPTTDIFAGDLWFCTANITEPVAYTQNTTYYYDGTNWIIYSPEGVYDYANNTTTTYYQSTLPVDGDSPDGLHIGDTFKPTADIGTDPILYYATRTYVYDGTNWPEATPSNLAELDSAQNDKLTDIEDNATNSFVLTDATEPTTSTYTNLVEGWLWNPSVDNGGFYANTIYRYSGTAWEVSGAENVADNATNNLYFQGGSSAPAGSSGDLWACTQDIGTGPDYDYYANTTYVYIGTSWQPAGPTGVLDFSTVNLWVESATYPGAEYETEGTLWACTANFTEATVDYYANTTYIYTGGAWITAGATGAVDFATNTPDSIVSATVPSTTEDGTTWACTGNSVDYVQSSEPTGTTGETWYNPSEGKVYDYTTSWVLADPQPPVYLAGETYIYNSGTTTWTKTAPNNSTQPTSPDFPRFGDLWTATANRAVLAPSGNEVDIDYWVYTYPASPTAGEYIYLYDQDVLIVHGAGPVSYDAIYEKGTTYRWDGNSWEKYTTSVEDYLNQGGEVGHDGGAGNNWRIDASGKLTANGASIVGSMEAIAVDELTRTLVDDGSVEFFTRALTTDLWTTAGSIRGGYDGTDPVLVVPQDFRIGLMTVGLGKGNVSTNVALGINTLSSNVTGSDHVAVGNSAMKDVTGGSRSIAIGSGALFKSTTPTQNIAIGHSSMGTAEGGDYNIGIGAYSLEKTTIGTYNVAIGSTSLQNNTEGNKNVSIGEGCLQDNTTGSTNVGIGDKAFTKLISGDYNIGIGPSAGFNNTTGSDNIFIGRSAGALNTGSNNVYIGRSAGSSPTSESNTMRLGSNSYINQSYIAGAGQFLDGHMMQKYTGAVSTKGNIFNAVHPQLPANDYGINAVVTESNVVYSVLLVRISDTTIHGYFSGSASVRTYNSGSGSSSSITELFF